jgi:aminotransferase
MINIFQPCLGAEELASLQEVFCSNWIGKGKQVLEFERAFAESLRRPPELFASTTTCTEGLFLAMKLFGIGPGDEVIVPSISFVAVGSAVVDSGARLVLCDVDRRSLNVTAKHIQAKVTPRTKAIYLTHYGGVPCEMDPILNLCRANEIHVIEDSACAVRSFYKGRACGTLGDMGVWSFDPMKTICTGDGGMIYLCSPELVELAKEHLYLGLPNRQRSGMDSSASGNAQWWEYQITRPGRRAIMNNIAGAIGLSQMTRLNSFLNRRREIFERYSRELGNIGWLQLPPTIPRECESSYYFFWIQLEQRDALAAHLKEHNIYSTFRYWPLHRVDYFHREKMELPESDYAADHTLCVPLHQSLTEQDVEHIVATIRRFPQ